VTAEELRAYRERLGLTVGALARLVGVDTRTAERYLAGTMRIPEPTRRLLVLAERSPECREWLLSS